MDAIDLLPMYPWEGPPLPRATGVTWSNLMSKKSLGGVEMTTKYGAGAWTGINPIGPSKSFVSPLGIDPSKAKDHPVNATELAQVLSESPGTGRLVSIPEGITIKVPDDPFGKTVKSGFVLAGPGNLAWGYYGPTDGYMIPLLNLQEEVVISGVGLVKGGGGYGHYGQGAGPCAFRCSGQKRIIIENVDLTGFRGGGVWFGDGAASITRWDDDTQRNILRHVKISHVQQYGFGYGCGLQGGYQSFLIEASILENCRHLTMSSGGNTSAYELRYCILGEAVYANSDTGPATIQSHQVDVHGGGNTTKSYRAGKYLWVHYCDFSANNTFSEKPNVCIRGYMADGGWAIIEKCRTKKRHGSDPSGAYTDLETAGNNKICMMGEEEGAVWLGPKAFASAGVTVRDNWYGPDDPPDNGGPSGIAIFQLSKLVAEPNPAAAGEPVVVSVNVQNVGDAEGTTTVALEGAATAKADVTLAPGDSQAVEFQVPGFEDGTYKFTCGELSTTLTVGSVEPPPAADIVLSNMRVVPNPSTKGDSIVLYVTAINRGTATGTATVSLSGAWTTSKTVTLAPGETRDVPFPTMASSVGTWRVKCGTMYVDIVVKAPPVANIALSGLKASPNPAVVGDQVVISVTATNSGNAAGSVKVVLTGAWADSKDVTLAAGETKLVQFAVEATKAGTMSEYCDTMSVDIVVKPATGTLKITTSISAQVAVDGVSVGTAPLALTVPEGVHSVSFGAVTGYIAPDAQSVTVIKNTITEVTGTYTKQTTLPIFQVSNLVINPTTVKRLQASMVSVKVTNTGKTPGAGVVLLTGWWRKSKTLTLAAGASTIVTFAVRPSSGCALGTHPVVINNTLRGSITVVA